MVDTPSRCVRSSEREKPRRIKRLDVGFSHIEAKSPKLEEEKAMENQWVRSHCSRAEPAQSAALRSEKTKWNQRVTKL